MYFITSSPVQNYYEIYEKRSQRFTHVHMFQFNSFDIFDPDPVHSPHSSPERWEMGEGCVACDGDGRVLPSRERRPRASRPFRRRRSHHSGLGRIQSRVARSSQRTSLSALRSPSSQQSSLICRHSRTYVRLTQIWSSDYAYCNAKLLAARIGRRKNQSLRSGGLARILPRLRGSHRRRSVLSRRAPLSGTLCERRSRRWRF